MALLKFKRSAVPAKIPALNDLALGELAINTYDGKVYTKKDDGTPAIVEIGGNSNGITTITSTDGSVTVTGTGATRDLSVVVAGSTTNVLALVRNNTGATLAKGTAVYINGSLGQNSTVAKALATGDATSAQTLGLMTANLANNAIGYVTVIGGITNIDTSAFTDGQQLYLSPTTAGTFTATKPYAPSHLVYVAVVEHAHPTQGKLFVKVQNGYEMDELHDVSARNPSNNDGLFYNTSTSLWEKKSIATALGYTPANKAGDTFTGTVNFGGGSKVDANGDIYARRNSGTTGVYYFADGGSKYLYWDGSQYIFGNAGPVTGTIFSASSAMYSPIFYDSNDTAYYVDAAGTSALNIVTFGSNPTTGGGGGRIIPSTGSPYSLRQEFGSDNSGWRYGIAKNVSGTVTNLFYVEDNGTVLATGDMRAPIFYDSDNTGYYINPTGVSIIKQINVGTGLNVYDEAAVSPDPYGLLGITRKTDNNYSYLGFTRAGQHAMGMGIDTGNTFWIGGCGSGFNGVRTSSWLLMHTSGYVTAPVDMRSPLFYDSNNTAYYVDPNGNSVLNTLYMRNGAVQAKFAQASNFGYSSSYKTVVLGNEYLTTISMGVDVSGNASGSFNGQGEGREVLFRNGVAFITPNAANTAYETPLTLLNGYVSSVGSFRAPIFYDSDNTGYFVDPAGSSNILSVQINGTLDVRDNNAQFWRSTNGAYQRVDTRTEATSLSRAHWYGVNSSGGTSNFRHAWYDNAAYFNVTAQDGELIFERTAGDTIVRSTGSFRAPIFYDSNNTGYYVDPNNTSNLAGLTVAGTITGSISGNANVANYLNGGASSIDVDNITNRVNSGFWQSSSGTTAEGWPLNDGGWQHLISATHSNSGNYFAMQLGAGFFSTGLFYRSVNNNGAQAWSRVALYDNGYAAPLYASIYYDANNTAYYLDPNSTGTSLNVAGSIIAAGNVTAYSDIRIKANVETIPDALDKLDQIRGVTYTRTDLDDKEQRYAGVIAQEIEAVLPEAVRDLGNIKAVDYNATIALLIQAVKELSLKVKTLEEKDN